MSVSGMYGVSAAAALGGAKAAESVVGEKTAASGAGTQKKKDGSGIDFTNITPERMLQTVNDLIKRGQMSLDESSSLLGFMSPFSLTTSGELKPMEQRPVDVIAGVKKLIEYNQSVDNKPGVYYGTLALNALQRLQGSAGVNIQA